MIGAQLGQYRILEQIGAGGMGVVYRARDVRLERDVAVKVLAADALDHPDARKRFRQEALALSRMNHPNICAIYEVGEADGQAYIVMEYVNGKPLSSLVPPDGLPAETAIQYGQQIAHALAHAHQRGVLHRDLKGSNVVVGADGRAKVLDFGLAKHSPHREAGDATRSESLTQRGSAPGTLPYIAPELLQGEAASFASDIWSLGVLLFHCVSGRLPFQGPTAFTLSSAILKEPAAPLPPATPAGLRAIVQRCLAKDPALRYRQASEVGAALEVAGDALSGPSAGEGAVQSPVPAVSRRGLWWRAAALIIPFLAVGVAALLWIWKHGPSQSSGSLLISTFAGSHSSPTFSPDGSMIAFISSAAGAPQVWVKNLAHGDPIQITFGDVPASRPRWSPKNDAIVFSRRGQGIWSAPPLGGPARRLIAEGRNPNFSADGEHLVFEKGRAIWMAKADGSQQRLVYSIPHTYYGMDTHPALSPDGRAIVFFLAEIGPNGDFWVISVAGGHPRRLTHDTREGVTPVWTPDGRSIVFSSTRRGSRTLWRIPAQGGLPEPLTTGAGEDRDPAISPDGKTMVYSNVRNSWAILFLDPASGAQTEVLDQRTGVKFPMFAPDGQTIAFFAQDARGDAHIFAVRTDGRELRQVTRGEGLMNTMPRWAPDGRVLYYYRVFPERSFRRVAVTGEGDTQLFGWAWETSQGANIDPQGERIVYELQNASGAGPATIIHDIASGREQVLADGRGHLNGPRWSRDGQFIAGARDDGKVVVCPAIGGECRTLATGDNPAWSGDGSGLYFLRPTGSPATRELWFIGVDGHNEKKVGLLGPFFVIDVHFDVSRQDRIVWTQYREGRQELWLAKLP